MRDDLKPCPFCGGEASMSHGKTALGTIVIHYAECIDCAAMSEGVADENEAVRLWNTRISEAPQ